jgi:hypothetical protein
MLAVFDAPWYTWSATGATIGVLGALFTTFIALVGAIFVAWVSFVFQRHLKILDAGRVVKEKLEDFKDGISLACLPGRTEFGDRLPGGWDKFATVLNNLLAAVEVLDLYGDKRLADSGKLLYEQSKELHLKVYSAVTDANYKGSDISEDRKSLKAKSWLIGNDGHGKMEDIDQRWSEFVSMVNTHLTRTLPRLISERFHGRHI